MIDAISNNVPKDTLMKAIATAATKPLVPLFFDYKGPGSSCFIIEALAENRNHVQYFLNGQLRRVPGGFKTDKSVRSYFEYLGFVHVLKDSRPAEEPVEMVKKSWNAPPPVQYPPVLTFEDAETMAIELNAQSVDEILDEEGRPAFEIVCEPDHVSRIEKDLTSKNYAVVKASKEFRPFDRVALNSQHMLYVDQFYAALEDAEDIEAIYDNVLYDEHKDF